MTEQRSRVVRFHQACRRALSGLLVTTLVIGLPSTSAAASPGRDGAVPVTPRQAPGTAAGKPHQVPPTATDALPGAKAAPGAGKVRPAGAVPRSASHTPPRRTTSSGSSVRRAPARRAAPKPRTRGFDAATSRLRPDLGSANTTVFSNADGTFTAQVHRTPVNRPTSNGGWVADPRAGVRSAPGDPVAAATPGLAGSAVANPVESRTTNDSTYLASGVKQNFSTDNALYVGAHDGHQFRSFVRFDSFRSQFTNAYVLGAKLYLDTEFAGLGPTNGCDPSPVTVAPITGAWNPRTLDTYPGPATGASIGSAAWTGGVNCPGGRVWGAVPLSPRTLTNWAHGWAANNGLAISAPNAEVAWKEFNPDDAYLSIEYAADGAGAAYAETLYASPWNNRTGWANVTIQNEGSATWTPTNGYKLGYQIYKIVNGSRVLSSTSNFLTTMPREVPPNRSVNVTATLPALSPGSTYQICWDMVHNGQYFSGLGVPQACYVLDVVNNPPVVDVLMPYNNATMFTRQPTLSMTAHDVDAYPGTGLKYTFNVYANGSSTVLATSGATTASSWVVPANKLSWGETYYWTGQVSDNDKVSAWSQPAFFTIPAPAQPLVTSHLGVTTADATVRGVSPAAGNYSTQVVDGAIPGGETAPAMEIRRTYNSLDPGLANAFGAGWASLLDARVVPDDDGTGNAVVVLPDGRQERFGLNGDGSFTAPAGVTQVLTRYTSTDTQNVVHYTYSLTEASGTVYSFSRTSNDPVTGHAVWRINRVTDVDGHAVILEYGDVPVLQPSGTTTQVQLPIKIERLTDDLFVFGAAMLLSWETGHITTRAGRPVAVPRISTVTLTSFDHTRRAWTYGYDEANNLASVCPPTSATACTTYQYTSGATSGSRFASMVSDSDPTAYWRLTDPPGATRAADSVAVNVGTYDATLTNVALGQPGALAGSPATSGAFNGTNSRMVLPNNLVAGSNHSIGLWFRTTQAGGTLFSYQSTPAGTATTTNYTPALYVGTDGKLRGEYYDGTPTPITSPRPVNDGAWHHVVLNGAATAQTMFLDGARVATRTGATITVNGEPNVTVGAGQLSGGWPASPAGNPLGYFAGQIQDVSYLNRPLGLPAVQQEYTAATVPVRELTSSTRPSGKPDTAVTYDPLTDRVTSVTSADGGTYRFGAPSTTGSTAYYRGAVLSTRPTYGYPMDEASGTIARNLLGVDAPADEPRDGVYNDVVLGAPGVFGADGDTAASFNGTSSYLSLPTGAFDDSSGNASVALWFRTKTAGGVLFSFQNGPIGTVLTSNYNPALYIGNDGKLRGQFYDGTPTPLTSRSAVNDGNWHMVLLTASGTNQKLWIDGQGQGTRAGASIAGRAAAAGETTVSVGAGYIANGWPAQQSGNALGYFNGQIAHAAVYALDVSQVTPDVAGTLYRAKGSSMSPTPTTTVAITEPGGGTASIAMDATNGSRTTAVTNAQNQTTSYTFDTLGHQIGVTDPNGHTTNQIFDKHGNALQRTTCQTTRSCQTSYYSYFWNDANPLDPRNGKVQYAADARSGSAGTANPAYRTAYTYTATGHVATVTTPPTAESPNGRTTRYAYTDDGLLSSVTDPRGQVTSYVYNANGQLAGTAEPSGHTLSHNFTYRFTYREQWDTSDGQRRGSTYEFDDQDRLHTQRFPSTTDAVTGRVHTPFLTIEYDVDGNIVSKSVADVGQLIEGWVDDNGAPTRGTIPAPGQTGLDPTRTTSYTYNAANRLESVTDPAGRTVRYGYDAFGRNVSRTAADGTVYRYAYSPVGELLTTTLQGWQGDPAAPSSPTDLVLESRAYDPAGRLASVTDAMGRTTAHTYFDDDRLQAVTLAAGTADETVAASYTYDAAGNLLTRCGRRSKPTDCGRLTQYTVDAADRITRTVTDPSGANLAVTRTYDAGDNILTQTLTGGGQTRTVTYGYDSASRRTSQRVTNGSSSLLTTATYDQRGFVTSQTDPRGNVAGATPADFTTTYRTDEAGRLVSTVSPPVSVEADGGTAVRSTITSSTGYNTFGEAVEVRGPTGTVQTNTYDAAGQLTATSFPAYTAPGSASAVTPTVRYTYDALGRPVTMTDPLGTDETHAYDQLGNEVAVTRPGGRTTRTSYDTVGEALSTTDPTGARTEATFNALGQQVTSTQVVRGTTPAAYTTTFDYDATGLQTSVTDPLGHVTRRTYNAVGLVTSQTTPLGDRTSYEYNLAGQLTKVTEPDGTATVDVYDQAGRNTAISNLDAAGATLRTASYGYDPAGNVVSATDPLGKTVTATYDALNRTTGQSQPGSPGQTIVTSVGRDADGHRTRYTDPNGQVTTYTYNPLGLRETSVAPAVAGHTDVADRTTTWAYDAAGRQTTLTRPGGTRITNTYDAAGRLTAQSGTGAEAATADRSFGYDAADRLIASRTPTGAEQYAYDDRGLLLSTRMPGWNASFDYDAGGRLTAQTDPSGTSSYGYDGNDRLTRQSDPLTGQTVDFSYDTVDQVTGITYGTDGPTRDYRYDGLHQLTADVLRNTAGTTEAAVNYGYDAAGHLTTKTTTGFAGSGSNTYRYDAAGRLAAWSSGADTTDYTYDPAGNRTRAGPTTYAYNARSQLVSATTGTDTTSYGYTSRGTLSTIASSAGTTTLTSDAYDQQITAGDVGYGYDALGRMTSRTSGTQISTFSYDDLTNTVISDGLQVFNHTPGGALLSVSTAGAGAFANVDRHGDVTGTFTTSGTALTSSATYDPYGHPIATRGSRPDLGYQGGWTDPATSFVDAAARWYNPAVGGFTSADTQENPPTPAVNANPYAYGNDDPLDNSDPSGHDACGALQAAIAYQKAQAARDRARATSAWQRMRASAEAEDRAFHQENAAALAQLEADERTRLARNSSSSMHQRAADNDAAGGASRARSAQNSGVTSGSWSGGGPSSSRGRNSSSNVWGWVAVGVVATVTVGVAIVTIPEIVATGGVLAAVIGVQSEWGLAASASTACTAGNAPAKPQDKAPARTRGPAVATDPADTATRKAVEQAPGATAKNAPAADTVSGGAHAHLDDSCFSGALQRADGSRSAGVWQCGGAAPEESCTHSFTPDTRVVMAGGSTKAIADVKVGDLVLATDPDTGETRIQRVTVRHRNLDHDFVDVMVAEANGRTATIRTTAKHPFWNLTTHQWTDAAQLTSEDALRTLSGAVVRVVGIRSYSGVRSMRDLTVTRFHTYYVVAGTTPVLVHNCGDGGPSVSIYRTPKAERAMHEVESGPDPAAHQDGDRSVYFGEHSVASEYQGRGSYAHGMIRYEMHPDFLDEFEDVVHRYDWQGPGGLPRIEFVIPADRLDRFNELTRNRTWMPSGG